MNSINRCLPQPIRQLLLLCGLLLLVNGCTSVAPLDSGAAPGPKETFSYRNYAKVLISFVDQNGLVDYPRLVNNPTELDRFYSQIAAASPDSHPDLFKTASDQLAYWINAYNATVLKGVISYYPIDSVESVKPPALLFFLPDKSGFFLFQRYTYGGKQTNLYTLENSVIRGRFQDPRIHFALNCASSSCPELPSTPFYPEALAKQLDAETRKFINDPRNVRYDAVGNTLYLSSIFKWYEEDFTAWLTGHHPDKSPALASYVGLYLDSPLREVIDKQMASLSIEFLPYDWGLNDASLK